MYIVQNVSAISLSRLYIQCSRPYLIYVELGFCKSTASSYGNCKEVNDRKDIQFQCVDLSIIA